MSDDNAYGASRKPHLISGTTTLSGKTPARLIGEVRNAAVVAAGGDAKLLNLPKDGPEIERPEIDGKAREMRATASALGFAGLMAISPGMYVATRAPALPRSKPPEPTRRAKVKAARKAARKGKRK